MKKFGLLVILTACVFVFGAISAQAAVIYGIQHRSGLTGYIYEIDVGTCENELKASPTLLQAPTASWNGNAYDIWHDRYYFAQFDNTPKTLYMLEDFSTTPTLVTAGTLSASISNGTFYKGKYYYIGQYTDDLYEVTFNANGIIATENKIADISGNSRAWYFGDIAVDPNGIIYGSVKEGTTIAFFTWDGKTYSEFLNTNAPEALQIAFGDDGVLYGYSIAKDAFYSIDTDTGEVTWVCDSSIDFSDLASGGLAAPPQNTPEINIKPYSWPNAINTCSQGATPVIIWGSAVFDVERIDLNSLRLGDNGLKVVGKGNRDLFVIDDFGQPDPGEFDQISDEHDGYLDLNAKFETYQLGTITAGEKTTATVCFNYDLYGDGSYSPTICVEQEIYLSRECTE